MSNFRLRLQRTGVAAIAVLSMATAVPAFAQAASPTPTPVVAINPGEARISGIVEQVNGTVLLLGGQSIDFTSATVTALQPTVSQSTPLSVMPGQRVRIFATPTGLNLWQARVVIIRDQRVASRPATGTFQIRGTVDAVTPDTVTIAGQSIVRTNARFDDRVVVGQTASAAVRFVNNTLVAREVEYESQAAPPASANLPITPEMAAGIAANTLPNIVVEEIELERLSDGRLVWEVETTQDDELLIDVQSGVVLAIERDDDDWDDDFDDDRDDDFDDDFDDDRDDDFDDDFDDDRDDDFDDDFDDDRDDDFDDDFDDDSDD
jgi:hypothetical protein